ncbi:aldo/keto reductase [Nonomuraea sp. NPDC049637]|uniref:aldo/keto reductase n=1 Tax=Nonomuraea sp. NPDC049637 TaxID=3154356 RepID=UPI00341245E3
MLFTLGPDGPALSRLGLGCMSMTGTYGPADPHEASATLLEALDSGVTMFDTGDFYGDGANEELLGQTLAPHRDRAVLATKTGVRRTAEGLVPAGSPGDLRRACEASLRRLRTATPNLKTTLPPSTNLSPDLNTPPRRRHDPAPDASSKHPTTSTAESPGPLELRGGWGSLRARLSPARSGGFPDFPDRSTRAYARGVRDFPARLTRGRARGRRCL